MFTNNANKFSSKAALQRDEMLEPYERKRSRTVLRRESGSNPADLADDKEKNKYIFQAQDDEALYIGGVFRQHENASEYVILTKAPVEPVVAIHDRMPVIIPHSKAEKWLYDDNAAMGIVTQDYVPLDCQMAEK